MATVEPCPNCGAKPGRGGVILQHRKGCCEQVKLKDSPIVLKAEFICCNQPMKRTDGRPHDAMCRHYRLLTEDCKECRHERNGILVYRCSICGRQVQDSPGLAQGPEALLVSSIAR